MNVSIIGVARSGYAAAKLAQRLGYKVSVTDACCDTHSSADAVRVRTDRVEELKNNGIRVEIGSHSREFIDGADVVVTSPGVPDTSDPLTWAREKNIPVISEIEFAIRHTNAPIIGITGTNGKTTTTTLTGHVLQHADIPCVVAGNIGQALSGVVEKTTGKHTIVLEISSFQLETVDSFHPHIAVWLNVTPDHMDRYASMDEYIAAKARIFMNMTRDDWAICWWQERDTVMPYLRKNNIRPVWIDETGEWRPTTDMSYGAYCREGILYTTFNGVTHEYGRCDEMPLAGSHNYVNILAVCAISHILKIPVHEVKTALKSFRGLHHRLENVGEKEGVTFINDSKATNVDALCKALQALPAPISLIAGGYNKNSDFSGLIPLIKEKVVHACLIGTAAPALQEVWNDATEITLAFSMAEAVTIATAHVSEGGTVLLAPGCASFDMYDDFEKRGEDFTSCVTTYINE